MADDNEQALTDRRRLLVGLGAMVLASCGGSSSKSATSSTASGASSSPTPSSASTTSAPPPTTTVSIPPDQLIPDDVIASDAETYNGTWNATFQHSDGTSGPMVGELTIDPPTRSATAKLTVGAGFYGLGSQEVTETTHVDLDNYASDQQHYQGMSTLFGTGTLDRPSIGSGRIEINGAQIPNRPEITSIHIAAERLNFVEPHPFTYEIKYTDGRVITGTLTFDKA